MDDLNTLLEQRAADVPVGAPPIDSMRAAVRRRRHRMTVLGAAAAVVAIAAGGLVWQQVDDPDPAPPVASEPPVDTPPEGYRYLGIGSAVIAVPEAWATNDTECGTPVHDTVVIDQGVICMALVPRPADVESVRVERSREGVPAVVGEVTTSDGIASGSVIVDGVIFTAESSSADGEAVVEDLLAGVTTLQDHTTVPGFALLGRDDYVAKLQELGLSVEVRTKLSDMPKGTVLAIDPPVGSVVAPGDTVTVTVTG